MWEYKDSVLPTKSPSVRRVEEQARAVFLDRDGVINELVYYPEHGVVDSPFTPEQFRLTPYASFAVKRFRELGFKVIVVSNQPGVAKGHFSERVLEAITRRMHAALARFDASLEGEYYCLHHPLATNPRYGVECDCRKPKPGLLYRAAQEHGVALASSFVIGDGLVDVKAGKQAGCTTILLGSMNRLLGKLMVVEDAEPDYLVRDLPAALRVVEGAEQLRRDAGVRLHRVVGEPWRVRRS